MRALFDNPIALVILVLIIVVIFGANKLPGAARSLGRSMKIFKDEVKDLRGDDDTKASAPQALEGDVRPATGDPIARNSETTKGQGGNGAV